MSRDLLIESTSRTALASILQMLTEGNVELPALRMAIDSHAAVMGEHDAGTLQWCLNETLECLHFALEWRDAIRSAEPDSVRFARACRTRSREVLAQAEEGTSQRLLSAAQSLSELDDDTDLFVIAGLVARVPLPPRLSQLFSWASPSGTTGRAEERPTRVPSVALLIRHNAEAVMRPTLVRPGALHQLEVEARLEAWPDEAEALEVSFVSVHPSDLVYASGVVFNPNEETQPLEIRVAGERPPNDPPLAITASARFKTPEGYLAAHLVGNTTLQLVTFNPETTSLASLPTAEIMVRQMMGELGNALPELPVEDRRDSRLLLEGILRFAHMVLDDRLDGLQAGQVNEKWFQRQLKQFLQADPTIGARIGEAEGRAGGTTDLRLGNIVLELKVEKNTPLTVEAAGRKFGSQATQYGSAGDSQVSLLAVLEATKKRAPSGVMGNEVKWIYPETIGDNSPRFPSMVGAVMVRSGFPVPSSFSRGG